MRGKVQAFSGKMLRTGITPAYAGKSSLRRTWRKFKKDHPRLCGEKLTPTTAQPPQAGSPPPMRGKDLAAFQHLMQFRITPAYAGKSASESPRKAALQDHPRLCGEKICRNLPTYSGRGSPPPMRGKAMILLDIGAASGITPAYAGKRCNPPCFVFSLGDHPRLCGEKGFDGHYTSPQSWITPAYAGKSECCQTH